MKRTFPLLLALLLLLTGCGAHEETPTEGAASLPDASSAETAEKEPTEEVSPIRVGFAQVGHESLWRTASTASAQAVFTAENGFELAFVDCDQDSAVQQAAVRTFVEQAMDYIVIDPILSTGWDEVLSECEAANIPVIVIDRTIEDSDKYAAWVGSDFRTEGLACGEWLKSYADAVGMEEVNILVIEGTSGASAQLGRSEGFAQAAQQYGWSILDAQSGNFTEIGGREIMESYCKTYEGQFNVVLCQNDNIAFGAMTAMDAANISYGAEGDVVLLSFDASSEGLEAVLEGSINADFECDPLAAPMVADIIRQLESGEAVERAHIMAERWFTHDDTVSEFMLEDVPQTCTVVDEAVIEAQY